jgi:hypothetical protein
MAMRLNVQLQKMSKLCKFAIEIFVNGVKPLLQFLFRQFANGVVGGVVVNVGEQDCLRERWLDVLA